MIKKLRRNGRGRSAGVISLIVTSCMLMSSAGVWAADDEGAKAPPIRYLEAGASFTHFTDDLEDGNTQFLSLLFSRDWSYQLRFDAERSARWGDAGLGIGASFTTYFAGSWSVGIGAGTGSGKYILPDYRFSASVGKAFLAQRTLLTSIEYVHEQSKGPNYYDRIAPSLSWWIGNHWIFGGHFNYDVGQPGNTTTKSGGIEVTWFDWQKRFIGVVFELGDVNYTQVGPTDFLVAYKQVSTRVYFTQYFTPTMGFTFRGDWATNDLYDLYGISVHLFTQW
jgi:YaiO family outer membrane protein